MIITGRLQVRGPSIALLSQWVPVAAKTLVNMIVQTDRVKIRLRHVSKKVVVIPKEKDYLNMFFTFFVIRC